MSESAPTLLQTWALASRPKTLPAAAAPVIVGSALAYTDGGIYPWPGSGLLLAALFSRSARTWQMMFIDYEKGADQGERFGPMRVTQAGMLTPNRLSEGMLVVFGLQRF